MVKQERAERTRRSLIRAAAEEFAEVGFVPATVNAISARAGVSNGALHFHFPSKAALAEAVEAQAAATVRALAETARGRHGEGLAALADALHALIGALADDIVVRAGFELARDVARRPHSPLRREWQHWVEDRLRLAEHAGALAEGVSGTDAARVVVAVSAGLEVLGAEDLTWLSARGAGRVWALLLPLLAGPPPARARPPAAFPLHALGQLTPPER